MALCLLFYSVQGPENGAPYIQVDHLNPFKGSPHRHAWRSPLILHPIELTVNHDRRYFCLPPMPPIILEQRLLILTSLSSVSCFLDNMHSGRESMWVRSSLLVGQLTSLSPSRQAVRILCLDFPPSALPVSKHPELLGTDKPYSAGHQALLTMAQALIF